MSIEAIRTPDERFRDLPGWTYAPQYLDDLHVGLRMAYVDEGPRDAEHTFLCLHGQPTWSYLYRKMIPAFVAAGGRVVAPDFFGFGRSDKPVDDAVYTYGFHLEALSRFVARLDLRNVTLVCQDWGGILGLALPLEHAHRLARLVVMNTALPTGEIDPGPGFLAWRDFVRTQRDLAVGKLMARAASTLTPAEIAAYDAPFPDARAKAGVRRFPDLVPITTDMEGASESKRAAKFWSSEWSGPTFMAVGMLDPVLGPPAMKLLRSMIRGCPPPLELADAGHFVQEHGDVVANAALAAFGGR